MIGWIRSHVAIVLVCSMVCLLVLLVACGSTATSDPVHKATPTAKPTATPTATPTNTPIPTPTPSYLRVSHGPTVLGVSVSNFFGKYGDAPVVGDHGGYTWSVYKNGNPYELIGADIHPDGTVYRVDVVNSSGTDWSPAQSTQACSAFLPEGSSFEEQVDDQTESYTSPEGDNLLTRENQEGDCFLQFRNTVGKCV
jgi:hypothetical protein